MNITILGTRGMIKNKAPRHSKHSGVLIDKKLLFDLGEKEFLRWKPTAIFITHLHPDHALFVEEPLAPLAPVYAPEKKEFPFITIATPVSIGPYRVTPLPTEHSIKVASCSYLIECGKKRVLYTGDIIWMKKKYRSGLGKLDCVIIEGSFIKEGGMVRKDPNTGKIYGHAGIPDLLDLFQDNTDTVVVTHFGSWFYKDIRASKHMLRVLGERRGMHVRAAHDGMMFTI